LFKGLSNCQIVLWSLVCGDFVALHITFCGLAFVAAIREGQHKYSTKAQ
jgi:hypothetical protein